MRRNGLRLLASAIIVILLLVMHLVAPSRGGLWLQTLYDSLHVPLFGIIAVCLLVITPTQWSRLKRLSTVIVIVVALSVLSEIAQIPTGRDALLNDLLADWFGAAGFLTVAIVFSSSIAVPEGRGRYLVILGIGLIVWPLIPLAKVSAAYLERNQLLPELVSFDARFGNLFYYGQNAEVRTVRRSVSRSFAAEVSLGDGPWPGIVFHDLWPNWEPYSTLVIEIENPELESFPINIRVHDRVHTLGDQAYDDRFDMTDTLHSGHYTLEIPLEQIRNAPEARQMDLSQIDGIVVFCSSNNAGRVINLIEIRLE